MSMPDPLAGPHYTCVQNRNKAIFCSFFLKVGKLLNGAKMFDFYIFKESRSSLREKRNSLVVVTRKHLARMHGFSIINKDFNACFIYQYLQMNIFLACIKIITAFHILFALIRLIAIASVHIRDVIFCKNAHINVPLLICGLSKS